MSNRRATPTTAYSKVVALNRSLPGPSVREHARGRRSPGNTESELLSPARGDQQTKREQDTDDQAPARGCNESWQNPDLNRFGIGIVRLGLSTSLRREEYGSTGSPLGLTARPGSFFDETTLERLPSEPKMPPDRESIGWPSKNTVTLGLSSLRNEFDRILVNTNGFGLPNLEGRWAC